MSKDVTSETARHAPPANADFDQESLDRDRARLAAIVDSSDDAIISKDLTGIITSWNKSAERIFGYNARETIGRPVTMLIPEDRQHEEPAILERLKRGERVDHFETTRRRKDGSLIDLSLTISPIKDGSGRIIGASKIAREIGGQRRMMEELRNANLELARINEDLEQFAFIAGHDLQEPVRNIVTYMQILKEDYPAPGQVTDYRNEVIAACNRMTVLIKDLLVYTEIRTDQTESSESTDLNLVLQSVKETLKKTIADAGAEITAPELPIVKGKTSHFTSLFKNLIENAIKYRSEKPPKIDITVENGPATITIAVADNGIGIDPKYFTKIFLPFKRLHGRAIPGSGVGLAICKRIADRYHGDLRVSSQPGGGTVFQLSLPRDMVL